MTPTRQLVKHMYASDEEYKKKPHEYAPCMCGNPKPHCWYCGLAVDAKVHCEQSETERATREVL